MASMQAHLAVWLVKWRIKRRLKGERNALRAREVLRPDPYKVPKMVRVTPVSLGRIQAEKVERPESGTVAFLYLHGGGYFGCSAESHRAVTCSLALEGFCVFAPNYRLAPEHPFPAALEDAKEAYHGLRGRGFPPGQIVVGGDSAGGGLTLALLLALREEGTPLPAAAVLFSPWTDLAATGGSIRSNSERCAMFHGEDIAVSARHYLGNADARNPLASPLYGDLRGLPAMLIHVGADEVLLDDSTRLAEKAKAAGVSVELKIWPVVPHAWQLAANKIPEARQSLQESAEFARKQTADGRAVR